MTKRRNVRYSEAFKHQVVKEYEDGLTVNALRKKYGIGGYKTIYSWIHKYGHSGLRNQLVVIQQADERATQKERAEELAERVRQLESALASLSLEKIVLESTLAEAEALLGFDVKKNVAPSSSSDASTTHNGGNT